jgi:hypothetical protein
MFCLSFLLCFSLFSFPSRGFFASAAAADWGNIDLPKKSLFYGLEPPTDPDKWAKSRDLAASGEQILLRKVLGTVKNPKDFIEGKISFKDVHQIGDAFIAKATGGLGALKAQYMNKRERAPIVLFGHRTFSAVHQEGKDLQFDGFHPGW